MKSFVYGIDLLNAFEGPGFGLLLALLFELFELSRPILFGLLSQ